MAWEVTHLLTALLATLAPANLAIASQSEALVIRTSKALGPVPGPFSTGGAFVDSGVVFTERRSVTALPSPFGVIGHLTLKFEGRHGTYTLRAQVVETLTDDSDVFANEGVWVIAGGTGAYATFRGTGDMEGTVDDGANLILRHYTGLVHFG